MMSKPFLISAVSAPQPDERALRIFVDISHELYLIILLCDVRLVDTDSIGPKNAFLIGTAQEPESLIEVFGDFEIMAFHYDR